MSAILFCFVLLFYIFCCICIVKIACFLKDWYYSVHRNSSFSEIEIQLMKNDEDITV